MYPYWPINLLFLIIYFYFWLAAQGQLFLGLIIMGSIACCLY